MRKGSQIEAMHEKQPQLQPRCCDVLLTPAAAEAKIHMREANLTAVVGELVDDNQFDGRKRRRLLRDGVEEDIVTSCGGGAG